MSVLFITACSLTKASGGTEGFAENASIASVAMDHGASLVNRREEVRRLVKDSGKVDWQGIPLKDLKYNENLVRGTEFGGAKQACYLPAIERYRGRFYQAIGANGVARCLSAGNTLILSGLYGLLRASEPIQLYSCPLSADVARVWRRDGLLTDLVCSYIKRNNVLRVFDLTAMAAYRELINWKRVAGTGAEVLHCFDSMAAGASALTSLGRLLQHMLSLPDNELVSPEALRPLGDLSTCLLHHSTEPPPDYPTETWQPHQAAEVLAGGNPTAGPWRFTASSSFRKEAKAGLEDILHAVVEICDAPMTARGSTIKRLKGNGERRWRYRNDKHRLVYEPDPVRRVVKLLRFEPRDKVYSTR